MRDDLTASEKRLIAALDRLDHFIDRAALMRGEAVAAPPIAEDPAGIEHSLHAAQTENQRLSGELMLAHERQQAQLVASEAKLAATHDRLLAAGQEAARLAATNETLVAANRALIAATGEPADEIRLALEAEIESLRAIRDAEIAQMGDLLSMLDQMIGTPAPEPVEAAPVNTASARTAPAASAPPAVAAVLEMPMPEQVTEFADASQGEGAGRDNDASAPSEERG
ncbi:hypothetical protein [Paracoccus sp. (in: a-proteobacteria)]|uniref:hypothetical protein n=1 Tax=Paracoccus sp. TaxID=267 RepID=UPI0035B347DF